MKLKFLLTTVFILLSSSTASADFDIYVQSYADNVIASSSTEIRTSQTHPNTDLVFEIINPENDITKISATTNDNGVAITELDGYHTKKSGIYNIKTKYKNSQNYTSINTFEVYPSEVSIINSYADPQDQVVNIGSSTRINLQLLDDFSNPVAGHVVKIISSIDHDTITYLSDETSQTGIISFDISSELAGLATYTFYDATADKVLDTKSKIVYFGNNDYIFANSFNYEYAAMGNSSGTIAKFEIDDVPSTINPGETVSFTVNALDTNDQAVLDYDGTIEFSTEDSDSSFVSLPNEYTFTLDDQGSHTFSLAISFLNTGTYKIIVNDSNDQNINGDYDFVVTPLTSEAPVTSDGITISSPASGNYSNNIQVITGTATPNTQLSIYDNNVMITTVTSDTEGNFSHTSGILTTGSHSIYVAETNSDGTIVTTSDVVEIIIDNSTPQITQVITYPDGEVDPNTSIDVKVYTTEDDLHVATLILDGNIYDLIEGSGFYYATVTAPLDFGEYELEFIIADKLGNGAEDKIMSGEYISVGVMPEVEPVDDTPASITNLTCQEENEKVILNWTAPASSVNPITHYRVHYGTSALRLVDAIDTLSDSTTWYVPFLENNTSYYFTVLAVDSKGKSKSVFDEIVSCTPSEPEPEIIYVPEPEPEIEEGIGGQEVIEELEKDVSEAGPNITYLFVFSLITGAIYTFYYKRKRTL